MRECFVVNVLSLAGNIKDASDCFVLKGAKQQHSVTGVESPVVCIKNQNKAHHRESKNSFYRFC